MSTNVRKSLPNCLIFGDLHTQATPKLVKFISSDNIS